MRLETGDSIPELGQKKMKIGAVEKSREGFDQGEGRHLHIRLLHLLIGLLHLHIGLLHLLIGHLRAGHHLHIELASPLCVSQGPPTQLPDPT